MWNRKTTSLIHDLSFYIRASPESNPQDLNCIYNLIKTHLPGCWYNYSSNTILLRMILNHQFSTSSLRQLRFIKFARLINNMTWYFPNIYFSLISISLLLEWKFERIIIISFLFFMENEEIVEYNRVSIYKMRWKPTKNTNTISYQTQQLRNSASYASF